MATRESVTNGGSIPPLPSIPLHKSARENSAIPGADAQISPLTGRDSRAGVFYWVEQAAIGSFMLRTIYRRVFRLLWESVNEFIAKDASSRGAAIAFYVVTSFVPVLVIVIAVAGIAYGPGAARNAIVRELSGLMGRDGAELLRGALESASKIWSSTGTAIAGVVTLIIASSGVFIELRNSLNAIWDVPPRIETVSAFLRARALSVGLVLALGFLLMISLVADAMINALTDVINASIPQGAFVLRLLNSLISFAFVTVLFAAIYKFLPSKYLSWRDVALGAVGTALLFEAGKFVIGLYLGSRDVGSSLGAAGALIVLLLWIYYSAQIFLFGATLTRAYLKSREDLARPTSSVDRSPRGAMASSGEQREVVADRRPE